MMQSEFYFVQLELKRRKLFAPPSKHVVDSMKSLLPVAGLIITFKEGKAWQVGSDPISPGDLVFVMSDGQIAKVWNNDIKPIGVAIAVKGEFVDVCINPM